MLSETRRAALRLHLAAQAPASTAGLPRLLVKAENECGRFARERTILSLAFSEIQNVSND